MQTKPVGIIKKISPASFFTPRKTGRNTECLDYANIQRREANLQSPSRAPPTTTTPSKSTDEPAKDTIEVAVSRDPEYNSDHEIEDSPAPIFTNTLLIEAEKIEAIKAWAAHKTKYIRKKRDKNSHFYYYMKREAIEGKFYKARHSSPKCLQEYRWTCSICLAQPELLRKTFSVYKSARHGAMSRIVKHLRTYRIMSDVHFARMNGYSQAIGGGHHTELDLWGGRRPERPRLTSREAT